MRTRYATVAVRANITFSNDIPGQPLPLDKGALAAWAQAIVYDALVKIDGDPGFYDEALSPDVANGISISWTITGARNLDERASRIRAGLRPSLDGAKVPVDLSASSVAP